MNLYIVESPLQLICAFESINLNKKDHYLLLIRLSGRGDNDKHLRNCIDFLGLKCVFFTLRPNHVKIDFIFNLSLWIKVFFRKYEIIYFGSACSSFIKFINLFLWGKEYIYLDDGLATLRIQKKIEQRKINELNFFTFFNISGIGKQKIYKNEFNAIKNYLEKSRTHSSYFIGQPVEKMIGFSKEDYIKCVNMVAKQYSKESPLIYIPHRVEDIENIKGISNIKILKIEMPVELFFILSSNELPSKIYSCYSTALITLKNMIPNVECYSFYSKVNNLEEIDVIYSYFKETSINIIEF
ncbi:hypothetical protein [Acinetobacter zhairhuonensis]|uniref:hypothetical protein n=1 Tax=Acinetobacter sp. A7.4 TaxID=2919921 RepID=UPI001F4F8F5B|nr:hypothetical protein [Acinetobacter sp. A7.4]MCJ8161551.1 hypothetical protein [Acinetobacter sp. A7.4]